MKKILGLIFILGLTINLNAQNTLTSKDSINVFYNSLFQILKSDYLHKSDVNWTKVELDTKNTLNQYNDFKSSLVQTTILFDKIKGTHCQLFYKDTVFTATTKQPTENDFSEQWIKKYVTNPSFEAKVIDENYGYILIPSLNFEDISSENIHKIAQPMYDQITDVKTKNKLKGWIIDLRFTTGGNIYPVLLALYDLLGDNIVFGGLDVNKKLTDSVKLDNGKYINNEKIISYITPKGKKNDKSKVVILTGIMTASLGEITAMSFKGRKNTLFLWDPTYGFTTGNDKRDLPFGAYMAITVTYDCDRNGRFYDKIMPDILLSKQDNFDNLLLDKNIMEAIKWMNKK